MAGTAALSTVLKSTLGILSDSAINKIKLLWYVREEQEKLGQTLFSIEKTLNALENGEFIITEPIKHWLGQLKDVLYDADDVLDDLRTKAMIRKMKEEEEQQQQLSKSWIEKVCSFLSCCSNSLAYFWKMGHRIKDIRERLDNIQKNRTQFEPRAPHNLTRLVDNVHHQRDTHSGLPSGVIGRDGYKEKIVKLLMDYSSGNVDSELVSLIAIHGMGGIGKTTLAKLVYNDSDIKNHFEERIWVCVSYDFNQKKIVEKMLQSLRVNRQECEDLVLEPLQILLREKLGGKRYMLVLDDVWNEDRHKWLELKNLLNCGKRGSTILVTTRSTRVVEVMGSNSSLPLSSLSDDASWSVFKHFAFKRDQQNPTLEGIAQEIARKCGGLPLALSTLGSLLYGNINEGDWKRVRDNEMWQDLSGKQLDVLPILKFSYDNLPSSQMKQCFAYCSVFFKDDDISRERLIRLWMAQGFLQSSNPRQRLEDIGNHYFNVLLSRSFFQDIVEDDYGNIATCKMHDLMHDLAQSISEGECLIVDEIDTPIPPCVRHMGLSCDIYQGLFASHKLRTFLTSEEVEVSHDAWSSFRYLRVLMLSSVTQEQLCHISELKHLRCLLVSRDYSIKKLPESIIMLQNLQTLYVVDCGLEKLPKDIGKIESLRHIDISRNDKIETLPDSICKLTNLQSLTLEGCSGIKELPMNIGEMISLRQLNAEVLEKIRRLPESISKLTNLESLELKYCYELEALPEDIGNMVSLRQLELDWNNESICIPSGVGQLTRLQTLSVFNVGKDGDRLHANLSALHGLNNLRGTLRISHLENATISEAKEAKLRDKQYLEFLVLKWNRGSGDDGSDDVEFLEALVPHENLQKLRINGYGGASFPGEWFRGLTSLWSLSIEKCHSLISLSREMQYLTALENLSIEDCSKLNLSEEDGMHGLRNLQTLTIKGLPKLVSLPAEGLRGWTCLRSLSIEKCHGLISLSREMQYLTALENLSIEDCSKLNLSEEDGMHGLRNLQTLIIKRLPELVSLPGESLRGWTSVRFLSIEKCHSLISLSRGMQYLTALKELSIVDCKELNFSEEDGMHGLHNLQGLEMGRLPKLMLLPKGLQHATNLQYLCFYACENLMALPEWLGNFASLESLNIDECPNVQSLPQGMQRLTKLRELFILACPHLSRRCKIGVGEDWPKIAHIPEVIVLEEDECTIEERRFFLRIRRQLRIRRIALRYLAMQGGFPHH